MIRTRTRRARPVRASVATDRENVPDEFEIAQTRQTRCCAKTMGFNRPTHTAYLPAVQYEELGHARERGSAR